MKKIADKLIILGRTNWEKKFYIKFKADDNSMRIIKKIGQDFGDEFFIDNQGIPKSLSNYNKWKDEWIPIVTKNVGIDIICGDKMIHMIFYKFPSFEYANKILDKYCKWTEEA